MFFTIFQNLNFQHFQNWFKNIIQTKLKVFEEEEKSIIITRIKRIFWIMFDYYYWCDSFFSSFSLYKYFKLIIIKLKIKTTSRDIWFFFKHSDYEKKIQSYFEKQSVNKYIVTLLDSLLKNQFLKNKICDDHSETECMWNKLTLILLELLMSWNLLLSLFTMFNCVNQTYKNYCAEIWNIIKSSLSHHFQNIAQNIELLQKFKTDIQMNIILQQEAHNSVFF